MIWIIIKYTSISWIWDTISTTLSSLSFSFSVFSVLVCQIAERRFVLGLWGGEREGKAIERGERGEREEGEWGGDCEEGLTVREERLEEEKEGEEGEDEDDGEDKGDRERIFFREEKEGEEGDGVTWREPEREGEIKGEIVDFLIEAINVFLCAGDDNGVDDGAIAGEEFSVDSVSCGYNK